MEILYYAAGVIIMAFAIAVSIALHEVGHLVPAKLFGVHVPQYMIGFGKTIFSFRRGETEYGFKLFPLGGYVRLVGMYPPGKKSDKPKGWLTRPPSKKKLMLQPKRMLRLNVRRSQRPRPQVPWRGRQYLKPLNSPVILQNQPKNTLYPSGRCVPGTPACWHRSLLLPVRRMPNVSSLAMRTVSSISCRCISALSLCSAGRS